MTMERLNYLLNKCKNRLGGEAGVARFLGVAPITLRRWRHGERPAPRQVEIILEIFHFWPQVTAEAVDNLIQARDEGSKA